MSGLLFFLLAAWCFPKPAAAWTVTSLISRPASHAGLAHTERTVKGPGEVRLHLLEPDPARFRLRVVDIAPAGSDMAGALDRSGCVAGVNGGFFHPDRTPLGLVVSAGKMVHPWERAKLLSGVLVIDGAGVAVLRRTEFRMSRHVTDALQAGPFLVDRGGVVPGLNATRRARRTAVLTGGRGRYALVVTSPVTLAELADILVTPGVVTAWKPVRALNLDGGSSTGIWVREPGGVFWQKPLKPVRNCVGVVPRH